MIYDLMKLTDANIRGSFSRTKVPRIEIWKCSYTYDQIVRTSKLTGGNWLIGLLFSTRSNFGNVKLHSKYSYFKIKSGYQYDYKAFIFYCLNIVFLSFEEVSEVGTDRSTSTNLVTVIAVLSVLLIICSVVSFTTGRSQSS